MLTPEDAASKEAAPETAQAEDVAAEQAATGTAVASYDYGRDGVTGFEGVNKSHLTIPIMEVVQPLTKEVQTKSVPGIEAGSLFIRALGQVFSGADPGLKFIPVAAQEKYVEWINREKDGGGFVKSWDPTDPGIAKYVKAGFGKLQMDKSADGKHHDLVQTFYLYGILLVGEGDNVDLLRLCVPFTSKKIPRYKSFMTKATSLVSRNATTGQASQYPLFAHTYLLRTFLDTHKTHTFQNFRDIGFDGANAKEARLDPNGWLYQEALQFAKQCKAGEAKVDEKDVAAAAASSADADDEGHPQTGADGKYDKGAQGAPPF